MPAMTEQNAHSKEHSARLLEIARDQIYPTLLTTALQLVHETGGDFVFVDRYRAKIDLIMALIITTIEKSAREMPDNPCICPRCMPRIVISGMESLVETILATMENIVKEASNHE